MINKFDAIITHQLTGGDMDKYGGKLIHQDYDEEGFIEVVETTELRSLHFGTAPRQSCLLLAQPDVLYVPYCRAMMTWQLFKNCCNNALLIGLGGGSLPSYLLNNFAEIKLDIIETRPKMVKIARSHFGLPLDSRLKIKIAEGGEYIRQLATQNEKRYDLLFIDAFNQNAMSPTVDGCAFFDACRQLLNPDGIMLINLWGSHSNLFEQTSMNISLSFSDKVLFLPVQDRSNVIALGFVNSMKSLNYKRLMNKAKQLEQQSLIEFPLFLRDIKRNNPQTLTQVIP